MPAEAPWADSSLCQCQLPTGRAAAWQGGGHRALQGPGNPDPGWMETPRGSSGCHCGGKN